MNDDLVKFELNYKNGATANKPPIFKDVYLSRDTQAECELALETGRREDQIIRNEGQKQRCIEAHSAVDHTIARLKNLEKEQREPWQRVLSQINGAVMPMSRQLEMLSSTLRGRVTAWIDKVETGKRAERERLEARAREKEHEAKYATGSAQKRAAAQAAKELSKAAKEVDARSETDKGLGVEVYYEVEIENRVLAAKLPAEAVEMIANDVWFTREIKRREKAGEQFRDGWFPGLKITRKTRPRFYK